MKTFIIDYRDFTNDPKHSSYNDRELTLRLMDYFLNWNASTPVNLPNPFSQSVKIYSVRPIHYKGINKCRICKHELESCVIEVIFIKDKIKYKVHIEKDLIHYYNHHGLYSPSLLELFPISTPQINKEKIIAGLDMHSSTVTNCVAVGYMAVAKQDYELVLNVPLSENLLELTRLSAIMTPEEHEILLKVFQRLKSTGIYAHVTKTSKDTGCNTTW